MVGSSAHRELDSLFQPIPLVPFNLVHSRVCLCVFFGAKNGRNQVKMIWATRSRTILCQVV